MKASIRNIIILGAIAFLSLLLLSWYLLYFSGLNIPEYIPYTPIKLNGFLIVSYLILVLIIAEKRILRCDSTISILNLTLSGVIMGIAAEVIFQMVRCYVDELSVRDFLTAILVMSASIGIISFLIAHQLITKNITRLILFIFILIVVTNLINYFVYHKTI